MLVAVTIAFVLRNLVKEMVLLYRTSSTSRITMFPAIVDAIARTAHGFTPKAE